MKSFSRVVPRPRYRHECVNYGRFIFCFGGGTSEDCYPLNNVHFFDTKTLKWNMTRITKGGLKFFKLNLIHKFLLYLTSLGMGGKRPPNFQNSSKNYFTTIPSDEGLETGNPRSLGI